MMKKLMPKHVTPAMLELYKLLRKSDKFLNWKALPDKLRPDKMNPAFSATEQHFTPQQLAELWGVSAETIREIFRDEPGVLKIGSTGARYKRGYQTLRIPLSVAERVHTRQSA
jgi:hypothetical protein